MSLEMFVAGLKVLRKTNVTFTLRELQVLLEVPSAKSKASMSVIDVARNLDLSKPSVSRAVDFLIKHGLCTRTESASDRRMVVLHRHEGGDKLLQSVSRAMANAGNKKEIWP